MGLSHIHNEYPYRRCEQQNQGFMTGLESYSVQTIYVTVVNVLSTRYTFACISAVIYFIFSLFKVMSSLSCSPFCLIWIRVVSMLYLSMQFVGHKNEAIRICIFK